MLDARVKSRWFPRQVGGFEAKGIISLVYRLDKVQSIIRFAQCVVHNNLTGESEFYYCYRCVTFSASIVMVI